jgi:hypothetical protein
VARRLATIDTAMIEATTASDTLVGMSYVDLEQHLPRPRSFQQADLEVDDRWTRSASRKYIARSPGIAKRGGEHEPRRR